jgi:hypothetical protein
MLRRHLITPIDCLPQLTPCRCWRVPQCTRKACLRHGGLCHLGITRFQLLDRNGKAIAPCCEPIGQRYQERDNGQGSRNGGDSERRGRSVTPAPTGMSHRLNIAASDHVLARSSRVIKRLQACFACLAGFRRRDTTSAPCKMPRRVCFCGTCTCCCDVIITILEVMRSVAVRSKEHTWWDIAVLMPMIH